MAGSNYRCGTLEAVGGVPCFAESVLNTVNGLRRNADAPASSTSTWSRAVDRSIDTLNLDAGIRESYERGLSRRVILCDGDRRSRDKLAEKTSAIIREFDM
ncbi:hypothetical protein [Burkholderia lata]|uniref:hypothetical protein n=1 Tax=Burkholderia lata (strain ATCC 17760 / DSM 23089 / LMG 22485 / NCIMB 9086 / R18194 / 383) TaxID=482957 RepID=UPI001581911A|nr:hypothetical protein [Burkholderia lata]